MNGGSTANGATIIQWPWNGSNNQQWQWVATGSYFNLKAWHSGKCANITGSLLNDGALLEQRTCGASRLDSTIG